MGRIEKWNLLPNHCRYLNKTFIEMFLEKSSVGRARVWLTAHIDWLQHHMLYESETLQKYSSFKPLEFMCVFFLFFFLMKNSSSVWLLWQLRVSIDLSWGDLKHGCYCQSDADILTKFYRKVPSVVLVFYQTYNFIPICIDCH